MKETHYHGHLPCEKRSKDGSSDGIWYSGIVSTRDQEATGFFLVSTFARTPFNPLFHLNLNFHDRNSQSTKTKCSFCGMGKSSPRDGIHQIIYIYRSQVNEYLTRWWKPVTDIWWTMYTSMLTCCMLVDSWHKSHDIYTRYTKDSLETFTGQLVLSFSLYITSNPAQTCLGQCSL